MRIRTVALAGVGLGLAIQLVPYGRGGDPAPGEEAPWPSAEARALAVGSCYDCHSRTPDRPWYSQIAPASWLVQRDIDAARRELDFTDWARDEQELEDDVVLDGEMPPRRYLWLHPGAELDGRERQVLAAAIEALDDAEGPDDGDEGSGRRGRGRGRGRGGD